MARPKTYKAGIVHDIPLSDLRADPNQPRAQFNEESLYELADSIAANGQESPIKFRMATEEEREESPERLIIVHGERRYRAIQLMIAERGGDNTITGILDDTDDTEEERIMRQIADNESREDLSPWDWVLTFQQLNKQHGMK